MLAQGIHLCVCALCVCDATVPAVNSKERCGLRGNVRDSEGGGEPVLLTADPEAAMVTQNRPRTLLQTLHHTNQDQGAAIKERSS